MISVITGSDGYSEVTIKQLIASTTSNNILYTYVASYICDRAWENRSYLHKIHLFVLQYLSPVPYVVCKICLFYLIPYGFLHI